MCLAGGGPAAHRQVRSLADASYGPVGPFVTLSRTIAQRDLRPRCVGRFRNASRPGAERGKSRREPLRRGEADRNAGHGRGPSRCPQSFSDRLARRHSLGDMPDQQRKARDGGGLRPVSVAPVHPAVVPIHPPFLPIDLSVHPAVVPIHPSFVPTLHSERLRPDDQSVCHSRRFSRRPGIAEWGSLSPASGSKRERRSDGEPRKLQTRHSPLLRLAKAIESDAPIPFLQVLRASLDRTSRSAGNAGGSTTSGRPMTVLERPSSPDGARRWALGGTSARTRWISSRNPPAAGLRCGCRASGLAHGSFGPCGTVSSTAAERTMASRRARLRYCMAPNGITAR